MRRDEIITSHRELENDNLNYKGYFIENADADEEPKFYEYGAHFSYNELYQTLLILKQKKLNMQKGKQIETILPTNKKKSAIRDRNNTKNKYEKKKINLNNILNLFQPKAKSRNIMKEEEKDELTFNHKNNLKNFVQKKNEYKSENNYKSNSNFMKIYKNKIHNIKLNKTKFAELTESYVLAKKKQKKFFNQRIKLFTKNNRTNNQDINKGYNINSYDISLQKSFQTQIKQLKNFSKKKINIFPFFNNSKREINKIKKSYYKEIINKSSENQTNKSTSKKVLLANKKGLKKSVTTSAPIINLLSNNTRLFNKGYKTSKGKKMDKMNNSSPKLQNKKAKLDLIKNYHDKKINCISHNDNKKEIYISIENNNNNYMEIYNTEKIFEKIKSVKHQIYDVSKFSINKKKSLMVPNINPEIQNYSKNVIKIDKNPKKHNSKKEKEISNILLNKNEKNSRNKFNNILKKVSLNNNFTVNKTIYNKLSKKYNINNTQQDINFYKKLGNKNNKNNTNNKYFIKDQPSYPNSTKKKLFPQKFYNNSNSRNYNSAGFISRKSPNMKFDSNNINLNSLPLKKSNKIVNLKGVKFNKKSNQNLIKKITLKNVILKSKPKIELINGPKNKLKKSKSKIELSKDDKELKNNKTPININKNNKLLNNTYTNKNNINISINISNNFNHIIYKNSLNNKGKKSSCLNSKKSNYKKSLIINDNLKNGKNDKTEKKKMKKLIDNKNYNNNKVRAINIKLPKSKVLNIIKSDVK